METILIGVVISLVAQLIKYLTGKYGEQMSGMIITGIVIVASIVAGVLAWLLKDNVSLYRNIAEILAYATAFYGLVIKNVPALRTDDDLKGTPNQREEKLQNNLDIEE
ncbi:hypothetical protein M0R04_12335 [Candidatus Dojkabacteria bacterium]|jgi:hypothetical protein|nr:hypothetical protein [Candidatus Dojkabacteria bacterium]